MFFPMLRKLIIDFPERNKYSNWIYHHRYSFISIFLLINIIINCIFYSTPYTIVEVKNFNGERYHTCELINKFTKVIYIINFSFKGTVFLIIVLFIFIEWNIKETIYDIKFLFAGMAINTICIIITIFILNSNLKNDNYASYYLIYSLMIIIHGFTNFIFTFIAKIIIAIIHITTKRTSSKDIMSEFRRNDEKFNQSTTVSKSVHSNIIEEIKQERSNSLSSEKTNSLYNKVLEYHKRDSIVDINYEVNNSK